MEASGSANLLVPYPPRLGFWVLLWMNWYLFTIHKIVQQERAEAGGIACSGAPLLLTLSAYPICLADTLGRYALADTPLADTHVPNLDTPLGAGRVRFWSQGTIH